MWTQFIISHVFWVRTRFFITTSKTRISRSAPTSGSPKFIIQHYCFTFLGLDSFSELQRSGKISNHHHPVLHNIPDLVRLGSCRIVETADCYTDAIPHQHWCFQNLLARYQAGCYPNIIPHPPSAGRNLQGEIPAGCQPKPNPHPPAAGQLKICRERLQLVASQIQIPTHLQLAEICRESSQLVAIQIQTPTHLQLAETCRERSRA